MVMRRWIVVLMTGAVLALAVRSPAERINHAGRILGDLPVVTNSILFNTTNADAVVSAMQIMPVTNPWNEDVSRRPLLPNSDAMIAQIISDLRSDRRFLIAFQEMNFVLVPDSQPRKPIEFFNYPDESDLDGGTDSFGLYPIPDSLPIEGWPTQTSTQTLAQVQEDFLDLGGDRHSIIVQPGTGFIWETWDTSRSGTNWIASNGAKFDLNSNALRPPGWTSGDAAGLPMFPAVVRFDECERGVVEHALRIVVRRSRYGTYVYPATHYAAPSTNTSSNLPAMGQRLRLKSGFVIPANWTKQEKAVLTALKKYGAIVADNGNFFSISITPDNRWPAGAFSHLTSISITNFEVVQATGPSEGPRSPGAPVASAGADRTAGIGEPITLEGAVSFSGAAPTNLWKLYSGPAPVVFGNPAQTNTTAAFSVPGEYTLMLSADDGIHATAYDAVVVRAGEMIQLSIIQNGSQVELSWSGGAPPFVIEQANGIPPEWNAAHTTSARSVTMLVGDSARFFRVRGD